MSFPPAKDSHLFSNGIFHPHLIPGAPHPSPGPAHTHIQEMLSEFSGTTDGFDHGAFTDFQFFQCHNTSVSFRISTF